MINGSKTVINSVFLFLVVQISLGQSDNKDIYHIKFKERDSIEIKKYKLGSRKDETRFFFRNMHSLKSSLFIFKERNKRIELDPAKIEKVSFSHPWTAYWNYYKAEDKPNLYLYEYNKEENCLYKYPVTIEFPPPPPLPDPSRGHGIKKIDN